jgi:hypothetical protein
MDALLKALSWLVYLVAGGIAWVMLAFGVMILRETFFSE